MSFLDKSGNVLLGVGVYTLPQAARLVLLPVAIVEMLVGPEPKTGATARSFPVAVIELDLGDDQKVVTFLGLLELWVASRLHRSGVPWPTIRLAAHEARSVLEVRHPLASGRFRTDGKRVFLGITSRKSKTKTMLDLIQRQHVFEQIVERSLTDDIVVRGPDGSPLKWYPLGIRKRVVLDPARRFGEPIDPKSGIPTSALAQSYHAEGDDIAAAAYWFGVDEPAVRDAVAFEKWLSEG